MHVIPKFITCTAVVFWMKVCWWPRTTKYFKISTGWRLNWTYVGALMNLLILSLNFIDIESQIFQVHFLKPPSPSLFWFGYFVNKQILLYLELVVIAWEKIVKFTFIDSLLSMTVFQTNLLLFDSKLTVNTWSP